MSSKREQKPRKLTDKQRLFVEEYLCSWNATQAAIKAGYSKKTAAIIGFENLRKPNIRALIEQRLGESAMTANEVLKRLSDQARASLLPFVQITSDGFVFFDFSHPDAKNFFHLIKKIKTKRSRQLLGQGEESSEWEHEWVEVELYDAQSALVQLGRYHALFTDRIESRNLDLTKLTDHQLERLAQGDDLYDILTDPGPGGAGTPETGE